MLLGLIVFGLIGLLFCKWIWNRRELYELSWKLPGPFAVPIIGNAVSLIFKENLVFLQSISDKYDKLNVPIRLWMGSRLFIYVDNLEDMKTVLQAPQCLGRDKLYTYIADTLGVNGVFTLDGDLWRQHRRLVSPSFNFNIVIGYLSVFHNRCMILNEKMGKFVGREPFDIRKLISKATLDTFLDATLGTDMPKEDKKMIRKYMALGQVVISKRIFSPWLHPTLFWNLTQYPKIVKDIRKFSKDVICNLIDRKLKEGSDHLTFVERLLRIAEQHDDFSLEDVRAEATNILLAASDTSSWSISFALLMLAIFPEHQDAVVKELQAILTDPNKKIEKEDLERMPCLERNIYESMRLFPVVLILARKLDRPLKLSNCTVTPEMSIVLPIMQYHRKEKYWGPKVNEYYPDHFLPENISKMDPYCYIPFSYGPRNCIGSKYAMIVMKTMVANILRKYRITTPLKLEDINVRMDVNIFLIGGHQVQIHKRIPSF